MLRKIKFKEFKELYRKHIIKDFPKNERPNLQRFRKRMLKNNEETYIFEEDGNAKGYCIVDELQEYILIAFLATYKENRGQGIGTKILRDLKEKYSNKKGILLEVEDPEFAKNEEEKNIQEKRIKFYKKSDFKIIDKLKLNLFLVHFKLMIYSSEQNDIQKIKDALEHFYFLMTDKKYLKYIEIQEV